MQSRGRYAPDRRQCRDGGPQRGKRREGIVPPTIGYKEPDPECDLDITPNKAVEMPINVAISNSLGFGGHNACILIKKV